jgi:serine/threonine protein kinase
MMGTGESSNQVFLIDFGLSKKFFDSKTQSHIPYVEGKDLTGTARYASVSALEGCEQSRRDDMEALGYVWVYLLKGSLPWMGLEANNRKQKYRKICDVKMNTSFESLCEGLPGEFATYLQSVRRLRFTQRPDYAGYRKMFRELFVKLEFSYDYQYDWVASPVTSPKIKDNRTHLSDRAKRPSPPRMSPAQKHSSSKQDSTDPGLFPQFSIAVHQSNKGKPLKIQTEVEKLRYPIPKTKDSDSLSEDEPRIPVKREIPKANGRRGQTEVEIPKKVIIPRKGSDSEEDLSTRMPRTRARRIVRKKASEDSEYEDFTEFHQDVSEPFRLMAKTAEKRFETEVEKVGPGYHMKMSSDVRRPSRLTQGAEKQPAKRAVPVGGRYTLGPRAQIPDWMNDKLKMSKRQ